MRKIIKDIVLTILLVMPLFAAFGNLVDIDNQQATTNTILGNIDMSIGTLNDLLWFIAPNYNVVSNAAMNATDGTGVTNIVNEVVTNTVIVGYSEWTYAGDISSTESYSITYAQSGESYVFTLWDTKTSTQLGTSITPDLNPLSLLFAFNERSITATRTPLVRNALGLARYADVQAIDEKIDNMDTSYYRVIGITNKNQSVQYVYADLNVTELQIQMPENGITKDWLVYVLAETNLTLKLPPANYWCVNESVTNSIQGYTPTALYFSQINDDTYSIGRQELIPITIQSQMMQMNNEIMKRIKKKNTTLRVSNALKK